MYWQGSSARCSSRQPTGGPSANDLERGLASTRFNGGAQRGCALLRGSACRSGSSSCAHTSRGGAGHRCKLGLMG